MTEKTLELTKDEAAQIFWALERKWSKSLWLDDINLLRKLGKFCGQETK